MVDEQPRVQTAQVLLTHKIGLHARPSVVLTKLAKRYSADVRISLSAEGPWTDAKSIAKVMKMKIPENTLVHFLAEGDDAEAAVEALVTLVEQDFELDGVSQ